MIAYDYYGAARVIANRLSAHGLPEWSRRINKTIAEGTTSGEILMGLRWTLRELLHAEPYLPTEVSDSVKHLVAKIDLAGV
jgi:hypothetical protein